MPICTSCTHPIPYLYTIYETAHNSRLEQCTHCRAVADPYVANDELTLVLDLILLKRDVYRHLLYNRGAKPRMAVTRKIALSEQFESNANVPSYAEQEREREMNRWYLVLRLAVGLISIDAFIRWTHLIAADRPHRTMWTNENIAVLSRIFVGCLAETIAFHTGVVIACYGVLRSLDWIRSRSKSKVMKEGTVSTGIRAEFRFSLIPLTIFYSSLTKLFLLLLLSIWRPGASQERSYKVNLRGSAFDNVFIAGALSVLDEDKLDREWIVRNVLGGMATGFGLRVILDCHPVFTTLAILFGWLVKNAVGGLVSPWVGGAQNGEVFLAYSIP